MKVLFVHAAGEHLGIEYLSAVLKTAGHEAALAFDPAQFSGQENARMPFLAGLTDKTEAVANAAASCRADLIAFSAYTVNYRWAMDMAGRIRKKSDTPIIFGGPHATAAPLRVIANPEVDAVVVGEGEDAILEILENMRGGKLGDKPIRNVWRKLNGGFDRQPPRPYIRNLDDLPFPDKDLFYQKIPSFADSYMIITSRGCPYKCAFCSNSMYHDLYCGEKNHVRRRSPGNVIEELRQAKKKYKIQAISFWDDVFTLEARWLDEFAGLYNEIGIPYDCYTHPLALDEHRVKTLAESGCFRVKIGLQTVSDQTRRKLLDRAGSAASVGKAIDLLHKHGISVGVDHMLGLPGEGRAEQEMAAQFYADVRPERINSYWMLYLPGAKIIEYSRHDGILSDKEIADIEEGLGQTSYIYADPKSAPDTWKLRSYQTFFDILPLLPGSWAKWMAKKGLAAKLPYHPILRQAIVALAAIFQNDRRYRQHLKLLFARKRVP